jgi:hypothetical protein
MSAGFFSLFINLLLLLPSIYMLQVYDRVLSSGSESTLLMLTLIMVFMYLIMGFPLKPGHLIISEGYELRDLGSFEPDRVARRNFPFGLSQNRA